MINYNGIIHVENLGKSYRLGQMGRLMGYRTLRENIAGGVSAILRRRGREASPQPGEFWALKSVNFDVDAGEVLGIIGHNGAGKSTLLKILSRITKPTTGRVEISGRVGSLLEVGTGFHPELTGRENIFLNGSVLGMSRREISRRFDEIVAFAEVDRFLDTPVKRYSSGMYVRLAFAVASHLEPEILVIDEVLAVGDQAFQKKCLGKMGDVSRSGRTVLFVSHNMAAVESLCNRCLLLDQGCLVAAGETEAILSKYLALFSDRSSGSIDLSAHKGRTGESSRLMTRVTLGNGVEEPISMVRMGTRLSVRVDFDPSQSPFRPILGVAIKTLMGVPLFGVNNRFIPHFDFEQCSEPASITCTFDELPLMPGTYVIDLYLGNDSIDLDVILDSVSFDVIQADVFGGGKLPPNSAGPFYWPASWEVAYHQPA